jgi:hypothetical protein
MSPFKTFRKTTEGLHQFDQRSAIAGPVRPDDQQLNLHVDMTHIIITDTCLELPNDSNALSLRIYALRSETLRNAGHKNGHNGRTLQFLNSL